MLCYSLRGQYFFSSRKDVISRGTMWTTIFLIVLRFLRRGRKRRHNENQSIFSGVVFEKRDIYLTKARCQTGTVGTHSRQEWFCFTSLITDTVRDRLPLSHDITHAKQECHRCPQTPKDQEMHCWTLTALIPSFTSFLTNIILLAHNAWLTHSRHATLETDTNFAHRL
jgi:hypothetical protein